MGWFFKRKKIEEEIKNVQSVVDFTLLDPRANEKDLADLCNIAIKNKYYGVCVNGYNVEFVKRYIARKAVENMAIIAVVGFPLGASVLSVKVAETKQVINDGADEIDVVINIGAAKQGDWDYIKSELSRIVRISRGRVVKAIIETCYFDKDEIIKLCKVCLKAKVDYIKTSTGFGTGGATPEVIACIANATLNKCKIKASGGIRTAKQAEDLIRAGASRIGTSTEI